MQQVVEKSGHEEEHKRASYHIALVTRLGPARDSPNA